MTEEELWLLSFYRASEISGSLFFGRLARVLQPGPIQCDMSKHFADEAQHAWYWTSCIEQLGLRPLQLGKVYQDQYAAVAGLPANLMEVLAITQVFEQRVLKQYVRHLKAPGVHVAVLDTLRRIVDDEKWHIQWVRQALDDLAPEYGADKIAATLRRFREADERVYQETMTEHEERVNALFAPGGVS